MQADTLSTSTHDAPHGAPASLGAWLANTLPGHIVLVELVFALPLFLLISVLHYELGLLSAGTASRSALTWFLLGLLAALFIWRTVSAPQLRSERTRDAGPARD